MPGTSERYVGLLALCEELDIACEPSLARTFDHARAVLRARGRELVAGASDAGTEAAPQAPASRTTLLYAFATLFDPVRRALEAAGLDVAAWTDLAGVDVAELPVVAAPAEEGGPDLLVRRKTTEPSLRAYLDVFLDVDESGSRRRVRLLDPLGLAYGIVAAADGEKAPVLSEETSAGLVPSAATGALLREILHQFHRDLDRATDFPMSETVSLVLSEARNLAGQAAPPNGPVSASMLLVSLVERGRVFPDRGPFSGRFLYELLAESSEAPLHDRTLEWLGWYDDRIPSALRDSSRPTLVTEYAARALERAREIAAKVRPHELVTSRDLLGGLLAPDFDPGLVESVETGVDGVLEFLGTSRSAVVDRFFAWLRDEAPPEGHDDLAAWRRILYPDDHPGHVPQYDAEGIEGPDLLDIGKDVQPFANLLAARTLEPPLAIGLFGDWGSGKSFFMKKLERRVGELSEGARKRRSADPKGEDKGPFLGQVVQIPFNAWHYVDTNLWASLVTHIFERLHQHFEPQNDEERQRWEKLLQKLDEALALGSLAKKDLKAAQQELARAQAEQSVRRVELRDAIEAAWSGLKGLQGSPVAEDIERLEETIGGEALRRLKAGLVLQRSQAAEIEGRLPHFREILQRGLGSVSSLGWGAVVVAVGVVLAILTRLDLPGYTDWLRGIGEGVAEVVAVVGGIGTWLGTAFRRASKAMDAVEGLEANLHQALQKLEPKTTERLLAAETDVLAAEEAVTEHRRRIAELRAEVEALRPTQRLSSFLAERASSTDYRQHLGLAALIRRDFERLYDLMREVTFSIPAIRREKDEVVDNQRALDDGLLPDDLRREIRRYDVPFGRPGDTEDEARRATVAKRNEDSWTVDDQKANSRTIIVERRRNDRGIAVLDCKVEWNLPQIDRIILYVDDLDRCPPHRVVEVLQAVHLLLAFPIFVVVVGVDARWVSRSLSLRFRRLWRQDEKGDGSGDPSDAAATPQDYLEKIFQIPFWLEPMKDELVKGYIAKLVEGSLEPDRDEGSGGRPEEPGTGSPPVPGSPPDDGTDEDEGDDPADGETFGSPPGSPPLPEALGSPDAGTADDQGDLDPANLTLTRAESEFMQRLAPLVGRSPRAVKRFVNVYRLIRAGLTMGELRAFLGTPAAPGSYRAVLFLLAVVVGAPQAAQSLFPTLRESRADRLEDLVDEARGGSPADTGSDWRRLDAAVEELSEPDRRSIRVQDMKEAERRVARFSFRVGRY